MLSDRLTSIANLVPKNSHIIDVGCEHALLDIYLTIKKNVKCIATDINENSIKVAKSNIDKYKLNDSILIIKTNGLQKINTDNIDTVIIAGMGMRSILKILKGYYFDNLIIQSNNDLEHLRREIVKKGYIIQNEEIVHERNKYYVIIKFSKGYKKYNMVDYIVGPIIRLNKRTVDQEYLRHLANIFDDVLNKIPKKCIVNRLYIRYKKYLLHNIKGKKLGHHY